MFDAYLRHPSTLPISLTPVCRRWYNILVASPTFWFRIRVDIRSPGDLPFLLESAGLQLYLSRSERNGDGLAHDNRPDIPLDIEIIYRMNQEYHSTICQLPLDRACNDKNCVFLSNGNRQLQDLLVLLAGPPTLTTPATTKFSLLPSLSSILSLIRSSPVPAPLPPTPARHRIKRWRSFSLDATGLIDRKYIDGQIDLKPLDQASYQAPMLTDMRLINLMVMYIAPHESFSPNLHSLVMHETSVIELPQVGIVREMVLLSSLVFGHTIASNLQELTIYQGYRDLHIPLTHLPKLRILKIIMVASDRFLASLVEWAPTGLELLHLVDISQLGLADLAGTTLLKSTHRLNFELTEQPSPSPFSYDLYPERRSSDVVPTNNKKLMIDFLSRWCQHMVIKPIGKRAEEVVAAMYQAKRNHSGNADH